MYTFPGAPITDFLVRNCSRINATVRTSRARMVHFLCPVSSAHVFIIARQLCPMQDARGKGCSRGNETHKATWMQQSSPLPLWVFFPFSSELLFNKSNKYLLNTWIKILHTILGSRKSNRTHFFPEVFPDLFSLYSLPPPRFNLYFL